MELLPILKGAGTWVPGVYNIAKKRTGGTVSARYCYSVWLRHLKLLHSCGLPTSFDSVAELGPGDSIGTSLMALLTGTNRVDALDVVRYANTAGNRVILNQLVQLLARREPIPDANELPGVYPRLPDYAFPAFLDDARLAAALDSKRVSGISEAVNGAPSGIGVSYRVPWQHVWTRDSSPVDLVFSQAALEHVEEPDEVHRLLAAGLKLGGAASHVIDFRSHGLTETWDGHLQYGDVTWKIVKGRRPYLLNRHSPSDHLAAMKRSGFEIIRVSRIEVPPTIPRHSLNQRMRNWSDEDLSTSTMIVVARRVS
jgi:hypothetical protein